MKFSADAVRSFFIKYYHYVIVGILFICLVVVLSILSSHRKDGGKASSDKGESSSATAEGAIDVPDEPMKENEFAEVNALVERYFTAMADGDTDTLAAMCSRLDDKEQIRIQKKAEYTENYANLVCYTKPGPEENSYIVFAYYEIKFKNIDTLAPGLTSLFLMTNEAGELYVYDDDMSESVREYIREIAAQDDVVDLLNTVDAKYSAASDSDETLKNFMDALPTALDDQVSAELAARENSSGDADAAQGAQVVSEAKVKETINVRKSASTDADKLGQLMGGDTVTVVTSLDNGWSQIDYQGQEAFVKTEFLEMTAAVSEVEAPAENTEGNADTSTEQTAESNDNGGDTVIGKVKPKETVKIRKSASTDSEQLGMAYQGEEYELYAEQSDGWSKIKYKGSTAYIKTEFCEVIK